MTDREKERLRVRKEREMRTKDISRMISEGGLGSDKYYKIEKAVDEEAETETNDKD